VIKTCEKVFSRQQSSAKPGIATVSSGLEKDLALKAALKGNRVTDQPVELASAGCFYIDETSIRVYNIAIVIFLRTHIVSRIFGCFAVAGRAWTACFDIEVDNQH